MCGLSSCQVSLSKSKPENQWHAVSARFSSRQLASSTLRPESFVFRLMPHVSRSDAVARSMTTNPGGTRALPFFATFCECRQLPVQVSIEVSCPWDAKRGKIKCTLGCFELDPTPLHRHLDFLCLLAASRSQALTLQHPHIDDDCRVASEERR